jgi:DNA-binding IclR family transcriptional regulator
VVPSKQSIQYYIPTGNRLLLCHSGTGWALLSRHSDASIERVVERTRVRLGKGAAEVSLAAVMAQVREVRRRGYAFSRGAVVPGGGLIAMPLGEDESGAPLALGVASTLQRLDANVEQILKDLRAAVKQLPRTSRQGR